LASAIASFSKSLFVIVFCPQIVLLEIRLL